MRRMQDIPAADAPGGERWPPAAWWCLLKGILKGFQTALVSMRGVGYHRGAIGFLGTTTRRCVRFFISHTTCAQE